MTTTQLTIRRAARQYCDYKPVLSRTNTVIRFGRRVVIGNRLATVLYCNELTGLTTLVDSEGYLNTVFNTTIRGRREPSL